MNRNSLLDYSLFIKTETIENKEIANDILAGKNLNRNSFVSADKKYIIHIGVIDYLQDWTFMKKTENFVKTFTLDKKKAGLISCVHPNDYASRFREFINAHVLELQDTDDNRNEILHDV